MNIRNPETDGIDLLRISRGSSEDNIMTALIADGSLRVVHWRVM
jgi:hypothetical protein